MIAMKLKTERTLPLFQVLLEHYLCSKFFSFVDEMNGRVE